MSKRIPDQEYIIKNPQWKASQDYARLRKEGLEHIEKLSSSLWTDYNVHDPGVTLLELLCYAITDLGYRTDQDIRDILTTEEKGEHKLREQFHKAVDIFSSAPVTFKDLRKLLIDVDGVRNARISRHSGVSYVMNQETGKLTHPVDKEKKEDQEKICLNGLYDVFIEFEDWVGDEQRSELLNGTERKYSKIKEILHSNRNLCEDFVHIEEIQNELIAVCADLLVRSEADLEEIQAEIFYQIDRFISPEVTFRSIEEMQKKGRTTDEIFSGPVLRHGFLDDEELKRLEPPCPVAVSDINRIIMAVPGVVAVNNLSLSLYDPCGAIRLQSEKEYLTFDTNKPPLLCTDISCITLYKNDLPYFANQEKAEILLKIKREGSRSAGLVQYEKELPQPAGRDRKLDDYYPVQNELPAVYRVGQLKVPKSEGVQRQAQSRQLKAYLLFFEQLLANYLSQLANVHKLFSWEDNGIQTYFSQTITELDEIDKLYTTYPLAQGNEKDEAPAEADQRKQCFLKHHAEQLNCISETRKQAKERKTRFLDHLMARFCESFTEYSLLMFRQEEDKDAARKRIIADQQRLLKNYPELSSQRGQGYDYRFPNKPCNLSGFQRRVYHLIGMEIPKRRLFCEDPCGNILTMDEQENCFKIVKKNCDGSPPLFTSISCATENGMNRLLNTILNTGGYRSNYCPTLDGKAYHLFLGCESQDDPIELSREIHPDDLETVIAFFTQINTEGFHLIEHLLLRPPKGADISDIFIPTHQQSGDPYSFQFTVVLPAWPGRFRDIRFRNFVEKTIRLEAPAHTLPRIFWLSYCEMQAFEAAYQQWAEALGRQRAVCPEKVSEKDNRYEQSPQQETATGLDYETALRKLIAKLGSLTSDYPTAELHDMQHIGTDISPVQLDKTVLGTI